MATLQVTAAIYAQDPGATPGSTGSVNLSYRATTVTYKTVRAKDGWVWLQQNLGSTQVATSMTDAASYGDLFQWGRWEDGHQVRYPGNLMSSMPTPNNPSGLNLSGDNPFYYGGGISWYDDGTVNDKWSAATPAAATATNGCDPCKQLLGAEWQLPSIIDWNSVANAEQITNAPTAFNSTLKLPASGLRNVLLATVESEGATGFFWSSTAEAGSAPQAMFIMLGSIGNPDMNLNDYNYRGIGMPLRCMKKSPPTSIKGSKKVGMIKLFPNPAQDYVVVSPGRLYEMASLSVMDAFGRIVLNRELPGKDNVYLSLDAFAAGLYLVRIHTNEGNSSERLLICK
jgi:hypothetical protein